jgi:hypothetical protein
MTVLMTMIENLIVFSMVKMTMTNDVYFDRGRHLVPDSIISPPSGPPLAPDGS